MFRRSILALAVGVGVCCAAVGRVQAQTGACCFIDGSCVPYQTEGDCMGASGTFFAGGTTSAPNSSPQRVIQDRTPVTGRVVQTFNVRDGDTCANATYVTEGTTTFTDHGGWFYFNVGSTGTMWTALETCGSDFDTVMTVWGWDCPVIIYEISNDDCDNGPYGANSDPWAFCYNAAFNNESCTCSYRWDDWLYIQVTQYGGNPPPPGSTIRLTLTDKSEADCDLCSYDHSCGNDLCWEWCDPANPWAGLDGCVLWQDYKPRIYADVYPVPDGDGAVEGFDILCILDAANDSNTFGCMLFLPTGYQAGDIQPCGSPDGAVEGFDILAVLDAANDIWWCQHPCPP